jgi:hypothetical protein
MRTLVTPVALPYQARIKNHFGASLLAFYPMDETAGVTMYDRSGHGYTGVYDSVTLAQYSGLGVKPRAGFNGSSSHVDVTNASFLAAINLSEGSIAVQVRPSSVDLWTEAAYHYFLTLLGASNTFSVYGYHQNTATNDLGLSCTQDSVARYLVRQYINGGIGWVSMIITWSAINNEVALYRNGIKVITALPTACSGSATSFKLGVNAPNNVWWPGGIADVMVFNRPVTASEAKLIASVSRIERVTIIGDSISQDVRNKMWPSVGLSGHNNGLVEIIRGGVPSSYIMGGPSPLAAQVAAAAGDDATMVIIHMGTGDNNNGDMAVLQAEVEEQLVEIKRTNPRCVRYYMNVLPRWTDNTTGPEVPLGNVRAAIAAACAAQGVTCWDTYTDPWITQAQTVEGIHPTSTPWAGSGHESIAARIGALLT